MIITKTYTKLSILMFSCLFFIICNIPVNASKSIEIKFDMKSEFIIGEEINFQYTILSDEDKTINYFVGINCPKLQNEFQLPTIKSEQIFLTKGVPYKNKYLLEGFKIDSVQHCTAFIQISSPIEKKIEKEFKIETTPSFEFNIQYCKDESCVEKTKVFILNDNIYLNYNSDVKNLEITANLVYPNKTEKQITLPMLIKAEQVGNYELKITAKKDGYKTINKKDMFGVISEQVEIQSVSICNADGECLGNENTQNCPQDCLKKAEENKIIAGIDYKMILAILTIIIFIVIIITYFVIKNRNNRNQFDDM